MSSSGGQRMLAGFDDDPPAPAASTPAANAPATSGEPNLAGKKVFVIDCHSLIYQVFHALPEMSSPKGQPVGAVFGFSRDVFAILDNHRPDYLFCAFDHPGDTFRHDLFPQYKAERAEMPEPLRPQIAAVQQVLAAMELPILSLPKIEADDVLATLAHRTEQLGGECYLVTADKDCRQLLSPHVKIFNCRKNQVYDAAALLADWGVRPEQVVDFQSLVGDKVDGVPGVPGIGPKNAAELLSKYETLDAVLEAAPNMPPSKRKDNLLAFRDQALLSRELVRLKTDVPLSIDWAGARPTAMNQPPLAALFREFGFRSLAARVGGEQLSRTGKTLFDPASGPADSSGPASPGNPAGPSEPGRDPAESSAASASAAGHAAVSGSAGDWESNYRTVESLAQLGELATQMAAAGRVSIDTETTHVNPRRAELVGISFCFTPGEGWYVPIRCPETERQLPQADVLEILRPVLESETVAKIGQNLKYDLIVFRGAGVRVRGLACDTMVADYLLQAGERIHNLDDLARRYLGHENITIESLIGSGKNQKRMDEAPLAQIAAYAAEDADVPLRLAGLLEPRLAEAGLAALFRELEVPLIYVLAEMEFNGIRLDVARLAEMSKQYATRLARIETEVYELAGHPFNIASPKQLATVLFTEQKLPVVRRTKTGPSTDAEVLEELAAVHPLPAKIVEFRQFAKLKGTYVDALPLLVHPGTGRVHTSFNQVVAATGRLSSNDPNLQNIPIRTAEGREIRSAFLPGEPEWRLLSADYSQIELRVLAHFSGDATLREAFARGEDIHARVASEVFGAPLDQVTTAQRRSAKAVNFGVIYGQSAFGLARSLGIEQEEARQFIEAYFARYPGVDSFFTQLLADCRQSGYVKTILGRRRAVEGVRDPTQRSDPRQRNLPERTAINTVIQGSAADLIKLAMLRVHARMQAASMRSRLLLQIHDELVLEAPPEEAALVEALVREEMSGAYSLAVPLHVDTKTGANWAECE